MDVFEPFERSLELLDALLHRDIERGEGSWRHRSGRRQAVANLKALDGFRDTVVKRPGGLVGGKIARDDQALAQQIVVWPLHADGELRVSGDRRPTAAHREIRITQRRFLDAL